MKQLLFILSLFAAIALHAQEYIGSDGAVHPTGTFPVALSGEVKGAPKRVNSIADRNNIPMSLRDTGMLCYVTSQDSLYMLKGGIANINWAVFSGGGAVSGNALTRSVYADGVHQVIAVYTGSNAVASVQPTSKNGSGMQRWTQSGDTTYMYYGDAPDSLITYQIGIVGAIDTVGFSIVGGGGTNALWTFVTDTTCQINYGAQYSAGSASTDMIALANTGLPYARVSYNGSGAATYTPYTNGGYNVLLSYNPAAPVSGNYTALPTDSLVFRNNIKNLIGTNGTTNLMGAALINEWGHIKHGKGYWNPGSAKNVINLLRSGANALHELGLKAYDGGFAGDILYYEVWKDYNSRGYTDSAAAFALAAFPAGTNLTTWATDTAHGYRITFLDSVIAALPTLPLDGVNVHFYATVLDTDSSNTSINTLAFKQIVRYLHRVSGKPVITNEFGTNNNTNPDIMSQMIDAIQELHDAKNGDMSFAFWNGADVNHAIANSDGSLTTYGMALRNKITETRIDVTGGLQ